MYWNLFLKCGFVVNIILLFTLILQLYIWMNILTGMYSDHCKFMNARFDFRGWNRYMTRALHSFVLSVTRRRVQFKSRNQSTKSTYPPIHLSTYPPIYLSTYPPIQELPSILRNPKVHCSVQKSLPLVPTLSHTNPIHYIPFYLFQINMNIIHPHISWSS
jgi:hypothetical protein